MSFRAQPEWRDLLTREIVTPETPGSEPTDRWVAKVPGSSIRGRRWVEVDPRDLDQRTMKARVLPESELEYKLASDRAAERLREDKAAAKARQADLRRRGRASFGTARKAAAAWLAGNAHYVDGLDAVDIRDCARDWMAGVEVRRGRGWRRLDKTQLGEELLADFGRRNNPAALERLLVWLFGRAKTSSGKVSRRWSDVDWGTLDGFLECVHQDLERSGQQAWPEWWPPGSGRESEASVSKGREATALELARLLSRFEEALEKNRKCLNEAERKVVERRIKAVRGWTKDPDSIPGDICTQVDRSGEACDELRRPPAAPEQRAAEIHDALLPRQRSLVSDADAGFALTSPEGQYGRDGRRTNEGLGTQAALPDVSRQVDAATMAKIVDRKKRRRRTAKPVPSDDIPF